MLNYQCCQGIYYFFYQVFKNKAVAIAAARKVKGHGDGTVGMFGWLIVAAIAGWLTCLFPLKCYIPHVTVNLNSMNSVHIL